MPKSKFEHIYRDLKEKIESEEYPYMELLPSENQLIEVYDFMTVHVIPLDAPSRC